MKIRHKFLQIRVNTEKITICHFLLLIKTIKMHVNIHHKKSYAEHVMCACVVDMHPDYNQLTMQIH